MKRFSLILSIFLLVMVLVSCGTTVKSTYNNSYIGKAVVLAENSDQAEELVPLQQTAKPRKIGIGRYGVQYLIFKADPGDFEANSRVCIEIGICKDFNSGTDGKYTWSIDQIFSKKTQANADGSLYFEFHENVFSKYFTIKIFAQDPGKSRSEPFSPISRDYGIPLFYLD